MPQLGPVVGDRRVNALMRRASVPPVSRALWYVLACTSSRPGHVQELKPQPAAEYITNAFSRYPLVALTELHGNTESAKLLGRLIRHPGFAGQVNDIVVEFGNARYQNVVDRYISGQAVSREALRGTWENTTQISDIWSLPIYEAILADIRDVNRTLPVAQRFRVLLGDPPIDWSRVTSPADEDMNDWRDAHYAWVVERKVRDAGRRALLFVGGAHISRGIIFPNSLIHLLDRRYPGQTLAISIVDVGRATSAVASTLRSWPVPSAASVRGTWLGRLDVTAIGNRLSRGSVEHDTDAILYLSSSALVSASAPAVDDSSRAKELQRRRQLAQLTVPFRGAQIRFIASAPTLTAESITPLRTVLAELQRDSTLRVVVKAFSDEAERNASALAGERARTVTNWLSAHGIARERLTPLACGTIRPLWNDGTEEHRAANRRAEIVRNTRSAGCQPPTTFEWQ